MWRVRGSFLLSICCGGRGDFNGGGLLRGSVLQMSVRACGDIALPASPANRRRLEVSTHQLTYWPMGLCSCLQQPEGVWEAQGELIGVESCDCSGSRRLP